MSNLPSIRKFGPMRIVCHLYQTRKGVCLKFDSALFFCQVVYQKWKGGRVEEGRKVLRTRACGTESSVGQVGIENDQLKLRDPTALFLGVCWIFYENLLGITTDIFGQRRKYSGDTRLKSYLVGRKSATAPPTSVRTLSAP